MTTPSYFIFAALAVLKVAGANPVQLPRDEFNSSEQLAPVVKFSSSQTDVEAQQTDDLIVSVAAKHGMQLYDEDEQNEATHTKQALTALKLVLLRIDYKTCCVEWQNLTQNSEIQLELKKLRGKSKSTLTLRDLLRELKRAFVNITYLAIDGQSGRSELEKYYNFYDDVQYYLRLLKVSHQVIDASRTSSQQQTPLSPASSPSPDSQRQLDDLDFIRTHLVRQLTNIEYKVSQDPFISSYIDELLNKPAHAGTSEQQPATSSKKLTLAPTNRFFDSYENFLKMTQFGRDYAGNVSMVRKSVQSFDQTYSQLQLLDFPSNLTRPSKQYEMLRNMSHELFRIRHELTQRVNLRVLGNRRDVGRILGQLDHLVETRPEIRMLGDEFSVVPLHLSAQVKQLTHLLNMYLTNKMTQATFYDCLSTLPEDFIALGASIAHEFETREVVNYSRFDSQYYDWQWRESRDQRKWRWWQNRNRSPSSSSILPSSTFDTNSTQLKQADARHGSLLASLFSG